jgi:hypothetical protein
VASKPHSVGFVWSDLVAMTTTADLVPTAKWGTLTVPLFTKTPEIDAKPALAWTVAD